MVAETGETTGRTGELAKLVEAQTKALAAQFAAGQSDAHPELLRFYAEFRANSANRVMLICQQCPHATRVASYRLWQQLGRQVAQGQRGMRIWRPVLRKQLDETTGEEVERLVGFRPGRVFDASQLVNIAENPLLSLFHPLPDDAHGDFLYRRPVDWLRQAGIAVIGQPLPSGVQGASEGDRIRIHWRLDPRWRLLVLIHELAHGLARHQATGFSVAQRELEAESTSFVVAAIVGLEHPFASDDPLSYPITPEVLTASLAIIQRLVRQSVSPSSLMTGTNGTNGPPNEGGHPFAASPVFFRRDAAFS